MKPTCKLCKVRHWPHEEHTFTAALDKVQALGAGVLKRIVVFPDPNPPETVTTAASTTDGPLVHVPTDVPTNKRTEPINGRNKRTRGRPRKWASEAERKKAYRERSK